MGSNAPGSRRLQGALNCIWCSPAVFFYLFSQRVCYTIYDKYYRF